jgi:hypothetical protein
MTITWDTRRTLYGHTARVLVNGKVASKSKPMPTYAQVSAWAKATVANIERELEVDPLGE